MPRRRNAAFTFVGVVTLAAVLTVLWRTSDEGRAAADLDRQRAAAKREGVPTEYADLYRLTPRVADDDNAWVAYNDAFEAMRTSGHLAGVKTSRLIVELADGKAKAADLATLRTALGAADLALFEAKRGSLRRAFAPDRRWENGAALLFPDYGEARELSRALVARAMLATDPVAAADDLRAAARMRAQFGADPLVIGALTGAAMEGDVQRGIRFLARRGGAWTRAVAPVLDELGPIPALRRSLTCEVVWGMHLDEEIQRHGVGLLNGIVDDANETPIPPEMRLMGLKPVRDANMERIVAYWRRAWARLPQDPTDFRRADAALALPAQRGPSDVLLDFILPIFSSFAESNAKVEANRRLTRAALALWSGETPKLERDPFAAGPLKLRRNGNAWTLYSVGPNGVDDGGHPRGKGQKGDDLVVASSGNEKVPLPKKRDLLKSGAPERT